MKRYPFLCSWCEWCCSDNYHGVKTTYCLKDHFTSDGLQNFPDIKECKDFKIDNEVTNVDLAWWPIAWAASEVDRLNIKATMLSNEWNERQ